MRSRVRWNRGGVEVEGITHHRGMDEWSYTRTSDPEMEHGGEKDRISAAVLRSHTRTVPSDDPVRT